MWLLDFTDFLPEHVSVTAIGYDVKHEAMHIEHTNDDDGDDKECHEDKPYASQNISEYSFHVLPQLGQGRHETDSMQSDNLHGTLHS